MKINYYKVKLKFINLHTHQLSENKDVTSIYNNRIGIDTPNINQWFSAGIHPWDIDNINETEAFDILNDTINNKHCLAVGECGLDKLINIDLKKQLSVFEKQIEIAIQHRKPMIIHCVKAFDELIEITKPYRSQIPFIIHGFNKSQELAKALIDKGFYVSLNVKLFQKNDFDFITLPLSKLFLESDNNEKITIENCYEQLAQKLSLPLQLLKEEINHNFETIFYGTKK